MEAVLSDSHRPPTLQAKLVDIYGHLRYQDFQSYYYAIIVSILEIFSNKFSRKNAVMYNYNMHDMMKAQLSASSRGCVHASTLRAERGIWEHILNIIGGKDSQPLWLPATFSNIGGKSLRITQGTDGSHAEGSSGPGANAELQTTKVDLQLMYQHERPQKTSWIDWPLTWDQWTMACASSKGRFGHMEASYHMRSLRMYV
ncbi:hypothetical protein K439DRAFT_1616009 [Ramaria rubella]|nr:hypothetical protein K439DRAFT_1616009 [Ramaria rubella]